MIARPSISRNEWYAAERGAFGHVARSSRAAARVLEPRVDFPVRRRVRDGRGHVVAPGDEDVGRARRVVGRVAQPRDAETVVAEVAVRALVVDLDGVAPLRELAGDEDDGLLGAAEAARLERRRAPVGPPRLAVLVAVDRDDEFARAPRGRALRQRRVARVEARASPFLGPLRGVPEPHGLEPLLERRGARARVVERGADAEPEPRVRRAQRRRREERAEQARVVGRRGPQRLVQVARDVAVVADPEPGEVRRGRAGRVAGLAPHVAQVVPEVGRPGRAVHGVAQLRRGRRVVAGEVAVEAPERPRVRLGRKLCEAST